MTRKIRTILFLFLLILFLLAASSIVLYSLGWRFDWETKKVVQTGIFYFKVWPKNVQIYLTPLDSKNLTGEDSRLEEKTDFFFGSALIENLLPRKYQAEIKKEGFQSWKKILEIKEREVAEAKNIVLIPESPNFTVLSKGTKDFFFSPDEKKIILKEEDKEGWALKLFEIEKKVKSHLIDEKDISKYQVQLFDLKFSPDSKRVLLETGLKESLRCYLLEIDKTPSVLTSLGFLERPEEIFLPSSLKNNVITFTLSDNDIYYLDSSGFLFRDQERLNIIPFEVRGETKYKITASNPHILLEESDSLYVFDKDKKIFKKIADGVIGFKFSPDSKKLVYFNNYEVWVLFLVEKYDQPQKLAGEQLFLTRFSEKIDEVFWYTSHYLIFNTGYKIKIAEIDDRDRINIIELAEFKEPKIFWNQKAKKLYILFEDDLYVSEKLVP